MNKKRLVHWRKISDTDIAIRELEKRNLPTNFSYTQAFIAGMNFNKPQLSKHLSPLSNPVPNEIKDTEN